MTLISVVVSRPAVMAWNVEGSWRPMFENVMGSGGPAEGVEDDLERLDVIVHQLNGVGATDLLLQDQMVMRSPDRYLKGDVGLVRISFGLAYVFRDHVTFVPKPSDYDMKNQGLGSTQNQRYAISNLFSAS